MSEQYNALQGQNEGLSADEINFLEAQTDAEVADYLRTVLKSNSKERFDKALKYVKDDPDTYFHLNRLIKKRSDKFNEPGDSNAPSESTILNESNEQNESTQSSESSGQEKLISDPWNEGSGKAYLEQIYKDFMSKKVVTDNPVALIFREAAEQWFRKLLRLPRPGDTEILNKFFTLGMNKAEILETYESLKYMETQEVPELKDNATAAAIYKLPFQFGRLEIEQLMKLPEFNEVSGELDKSNESSDSNASRMSTTSNESNEQNALNQTIEPSDEEVLNELLSFGYNRDQLKAEYDEIINLELKKKFLGTDYEIIKYALRKLLQLPGAGYSELLNKLGYKLGGFTKADIQEEYNQALIGKRLMRIKPVAVDKKSKLIMVLKKYLLEQIFKLPDFN